MLIYIQDIIYLPKYNTEIVYNNKSINPEVNTFDEFKKNFKSYIKHPNALTYTPVDPYSIIDVFGINQYYHNKKEVSNAIRNREMIIYSVFYRADKEQNIDDHNQDCFYRASSDNKLTYEEAKEKYSCGSKLVYFYQDHILRSYDVYGCFEPYLNFYDFRVCAEPYKKYNLGDYVKFYDKNFIIRNGIITLKYSVYSSEFYEIYDEENNALYYDDDIPCAEDVIESFGHDISKVKDIVLNVDNYHGIYYVDEYKEFIKSI